MSVSREIINGAPQEPRRVEEINGVIFALASPSGFHSAALLNLAYALKSFFKDKKCDVFTYIDITLDENINLVPDLSVICDYNKFTKGRKKYRGSPEIVIEILSPSTAKRDRADKFELYEKYAIKEYWIVDVSNKLLEQYVLSDGKYNRPLVYVALDEEERDENDTVLNSVVFPELTINISEIFDS
jgi:Uma2 family endonuclease